MIATVTRPGSLRGYDRSWLRETCRGLTLWALVIPQGLAYGQLAGLPPMTGLYVAIGDARLCAVRLEPVPLARARVIRRDDRRCRAWPARRGDQAKYAALAGLLSLLVAGFLIIGFVARLGVITRLLSAPVLTGYLAGSGIVIVISQLTKVTGISTTRPVPVLLRGLVRNSDR